MKETVTSELFHPAALAAGAALALTESAVCCTLKVRLVEAVFPALSVAVPLNVSCAPAVVTLIAVRTARRAGKRVRANKRYDRWEGDHSINRHRTYCRSDGRICFVDVQRDGSRRMVAVRICGRHRNYLIRPFSTFSVTVQDTAPAARRLSRRKKAYGGVLFQPLAFGASEIVWGSWGQE